MAQVHQNIELFYNIEQQYLPIPENECEENVIEISLKNEIFY